MDFGRFVRSVECFPVREILVTNHFLRVEAVSMIAKNYVKLHIRFTETDIILAPILVSPNKWSKPFQSHVDAFKKCLVRNTEKN